MSLHFILRVNLTEIGSVVIQCADADRGEPDPDAVYRYDVTVDDRPTGRPRARYTTTIEHRYGDGAWVLVRAALVQVASMTGPAPDLSAPVFRLPDPETVRLRHHHPHPPLAQDGLYGHVHVVRGSLVAHEHGPDGHFRIQRVQPDPSPTKEN